MNYLDPSSAKPIRSVAGHQKPVISLCAADSKSVLTGSYDGRVCAWDISSGDAEIISEGGGGVVGFAASEGGVYSISQDDVLKEIDIGKLSLGYDPFRGEANGSGSTGTGSTPKGVSTSKDDIVFIATIKDIQIVQKGKKLASETTKYTPSTIAANPSVKGEFAVGAEVYPLNPLSDLRTPKYTSTHTTAPQSV